MKWSTAAPRAVVGGCLGEGPTQPMAMAAMGSSDELRAAAESCRLMMQEQEQTLHEHHLLPY